MNSVISIIFLIFAIEVRAQNIPNCKQSDIFKINTDHLQQKKKWSSNENWLAKEVELIYQLNQVGLQLVLRHSLVTHETKIVCYSSGMRTENSINQSFLFPVSVDDSQSISYWNLHLLLKPDGTIGYWFQPEIRRLAWISEKKEKLLTFYDLSPSLGAAFLRQVTKDSVQIIKILFDK